VSVRGPLAAFFAFGAFWGAFGVLLPELKEQTGASVTALGLALLAVAGAALPAMLLAGAAIDRFGLRLLAPTLAGFAVAGLLLAAARSVPELVLVFMLMGAGSGAVDVGINAAVASREAATGARIMHKAHALFSGGFLTAAVFVGLAREAGADPAWILAAPAALLAVAGVSNRRAPAAPPRDPTPRGVSGRSRTLIALGVLCAAAFVVEGGIEDWSALYLETTFDASPAWSGLGPGFFAGAMVAGRTLGQRLGGRIADIALLAGGAATAGAGLAAAATAPAVPVALAGFFTAGAGISLAAPVLFGAAGRDVEESARGSAVATVATLSYLGFLGGPPLVGAVSGAFGLRAGLGTMAIVAALLALATASFGRALPLRRLQHPARG
jgi:MFS family permease